MIRSKRNEWPVGNIFASIPVPGDDQEAAENSRDDSAERHRGKDSWSR
jgi:hypothetical protein